MYPREDCIQVIDIEALSWITEYEVKDTVKIANEPAYHIPEQLYKKILGGWYGIFLSLETHD